MLESGESARIKLIRSAQNVIAERPRKGGAHGSGGAAVGGNQKCHTG
jgi:hypothetical protein